MKHHMIRNELHPGITMHKIPVHPGFAGAIFTFGTMAIFLAGVPGLGFFLALAITLGMGVGAFLQWMHR